jgi:hypothetical protein
VDVELTDEQRREAVTKAARMLSAGFGGAETYFSMGSETVNDLFAGVDFDEVSGDDLRVMATRAVQLVYGLAVVGVQAFNRLEKATGRSRSDVLDEIEREHDENL